MQDALNEAVKMLLKPIQDRPRELYHDLGGILLIDDGGGQPIEVFDDATAVHFFLVWLHSRRETAAHSSDIRTRRAKFNLLKGGKL